MPVGWTVSARPGAMHCSCSGSRGAQRRGGRSAPPSRDPPMSGAVSSAARDSSPSRARPRGGNPADVRRGQLGRERQQPVRLQPAGLRPGRGQRAFERAAEGPERGLRRRAGTAREAGGHEHPVVRKGKGRAAGMQPAPAPGAQHFPALRTHPRQCAAGIAARLRPGPARRPETRARPMDHLDRAALGRGVGQRAGERAQGLAVDPGKGRQLHDEAHGPRVDVELARFVEGAPGQLRVQHRRHGGQRPGTRRLLPLEEFEQPPDRGSAGRAHFSLQPAGSSTTRTCDASR